MTKIIILSVAILFFVGCKNTNKTDNAITSDLIQNPISANNNGDNNDLPIAKFNNKSHDFGIIIQGEKVSHNFKFKNIGKSNLLIKDASASCGCTVPSFPTEPIAPGEEGEIEVVFDSSNRSGRQNKTVSVITNSQPNTIRLSFSCQIVIPKK